ncbi:carboxypeptidase-like regulatory domain-containing protein [Bacteroides thetaiotaomicron]|nr:carboxypeptidase-like regulatory domain-containing protein [Bacteroides thetaiotaomicron]
MMVVANHYSGVSVAVKGTTSGTITDLDGKFSINARNK